ncbi:DUF2332 domain-containing protein [Nocardioides mangrovicus]|uniref:DUF2332 domain-containing protein n=1 Tax=Nocardioides mangrovicus TaxID=2478913 RepID=A0A3L8P0L0_9ACTN|nr:DUF2332 domain-containing protein [Nocardioides mangrovicus]RLV48976.1 DUF2332 domain-containing protein [Nocardioides mangrovicus]
MDDPREDLADRYLRFAEEAREESPCFVAWAEAVAHDAEVLAWIAALPAPKQQPNLVFAAARFHGVAAPGPYAGLREALLGDDGTIRRTIEQRATQTNEVGRLATLVPVFARWEGPLALLEVGASGGLCLYPDRYDYDWGSARLSGSGGPTLVAAATGPVPYPASHPDVAWRGGLDLHPLDVTDADAAGWLETLVWPEADERRERLRAAIEIARADPPRLVRGDALTDLPALLGQAEEHGTVVVFHSAVAAYLDPAGREAFEQTMRALVATGRCHWVSNEAPGVVPGVAVPEPVRATRFLLAVDGEPVAWTHGHGADLAWL